jgi:hypothetical protein
MAWLLPAGITADPFIEKWKFNAAGNPILKVSGSRLLLTNDTDTRELISLSKEDDTNIYVDSFFYEVTYDDKLKVRQFVKEQNRTMLGLLNDLIVYAEGKWFPGKVIMYGVGTVGLTDVWRGVVKEHQQGGTDIIHENIRRTHVQDAMARAWKLLSQRKQNGKPYDTSVAKPLKGLTGLELAIFNDMVRRLGPLYHPASVAAELKLIEPMMVYGYYGLILETASAFLDRAYLYEIIRRLCKYVENKFKELQKFLAKSTILQERLVPLLAVPAARDAFQKFVRRAGFGKNIDSNNTAIEHILHNGPILKLRWPFQDRIKGNFTDDKIKLANEPFCDLAAAVRSH